MEISEVRVKLVNNPKERLKAFCSITLDNDFVIRDLKIIDGANGTFVAMPSRKLADRCPGCGHKNHLRARFCNECGKKLGENRRARSGRNKLHADIAHPINAACRERIQSLVVEAYQDELERSRQPGYKPPDLDDLDVYEDEAADAAAPQAAASESNDKHDYAEGGGYDDLIADLKRDAASRRSSRSSGLSETSTIGTTMMTSASTEESTDTDVADVAHEVETDETPTASETSQPDSSHKDNFGAGL